MKIPATDLQDDLDRLTTQRDQYALAYATAPTTAIRARHGATLDRLGAEIETCQDERHQRDPSKSLAARPMIELAEAPAGVSGRFARSQDVLRTWLRPAVRTAMVCAVVSAAAVVGASLVLEPPQPQTSSDQPRR